MSMKALRKALKNKNVDKFEVAIKAGNGRWYTTAASFNSFVSQILDFEGLIEVLSRAETDEIEVSTGWEGLGE
jgi:uncharacterized membrane protein